MSPSAFRSARIGGRIPVDQFAPDRHRRRGECPVPTIVATTMAAWTAWPSWLTWADILASLAASSGLPGQTSPKASMKICAPIYPATVGPLSWMESDLGEGIRYRRRSQAVCSVELPSPPHQSTVLCSMR